MEFKGCLDREVGAFLVSAPIRQVTATRGEKQTLPGRDGFLLIPKGYQEITIKQDLFVRDYQHLDEVRQWLIGSGDLVFGDEPELAYDATILTVTPVTQAFKRLRGLKFSVTFTCQPFRHQVRESKFVLTSSKIIPCYGTVEAMPLVKVEGNGMQTLTINGRSMTLSLTSGVPLFLDCDAGVAYTETNGVKAFAGDRVIVLDDWFVLNGYKQRCRGNPCNVAFSSGITRVTIQPRWRWA